mmetsp:Transcript_5811/g.7609  ORF Transcript_5811/g.7609 Transcript_5811/m.7609 type:complete len:119 (+) Transcript_5811:218-574(+)
MMPGSSNKQVCLKHRLLSGTNCIKCWHLITMSIDRRKRKMPIEAGGQTLATLLVYLNNVPHGGQTRFGLLKKQQQQQQSKNDNNNTIDDDDNTKFTIQPAARGRCSVIFLADACGREF